MKNHASRPEHVSESYWAACGHSSLPLNAAGELVVSDDFLRIFLRAPELAPVPESCTAELSLHEALLSEPRRAVSAAELSSLADPDARENYSVWLRFRERLLAQPSLEASYMALFEGQGVDVPPGFVHQLTQVLLRHVLGDEASMWQVRVAEMMFATQKISVLEDGSVMAADEATVERHASGAAFGSLGELLRKGNMPTRSIDLNVLRAEDEEAFWETARDDAGVIGDVRWRREWVLNLNHGSPALEAMCRIIERWVAHFLKVEVLVKVEKEIDDDQWRWHLGLDAQASSILNDLYRGLEVADSSLKRLLCLFSLHFNNPMDMAAGVRGYPVYLAMAMDEHQRLRLKPQNLLLNLPLAQRS